MSVSAIRRFPTEQEIDEEVARDATETIHQRISGALRERGQEEFYYIRSLCMIATMFASSLSERGTQIEVFCPEDELRRAKVPTILRVGLANRIVLYPMDEAAYGDFKQRMEQAGRGIGEYEVFTQNADGTWDYEECY